jgi:transcriptional regulator with XRE-family HTH domain
MTILERIQELCKERNTNPSKLEIELSFGKGTLYKWDKSSPNTDKLSKVADYFNVSVDYLIGKTEYRTYADALGKWTNFDKKYNTEHISKDVHKLEDGKEIYTIAAHHDGDEWSEEEIQEIENFLEFVKSKREKK